MKLKLKADPTFQATVKIPVPGAKEPGEIVLTFKHRTRDEHTAFIEECRAEGSSVSSGAGYVLAVAVGWDLEEPFTRENVETFLQHHHRAETAIAITYTHQLLMAASGN
jgi:hypothetical protein